MKLLIKDNLHIYDFTDTLEKFDLEINNIDFSYLKNSIKERASIVLAYESFDIDILKDINPDKSLLFANESPKYIYISSRNKKKFGQISIGPSLDYQEICQFFGI